MGRRRRAPLVEVLGRVVAAGIVVAAACGGDDEGATGPGDTRDAREAPESTTTSRPPVTPLRGIRGEVPGRPALAAKLDGTAQGRPQIGLGQADVVFEELVEGGLTRLLAVFHSQRPDDLGPVRSARSTDIPLLVPLDRPVFVWSGANPTFAAAVERAAVVDAGYAAVPGDYRRSSRRPAPFNLFADPAELWALAPANASPPPPLFEYRPAGTPLAGPGVTTRTSYRTAEGEGLSTSVAWSWDPGSQEWLRSQDGTPHVAADGSRIAVPNVVVRETPYRDSGQRDSTGAVVPEAVSVGQGDAWLLSGGRVQAGRWSKPSAEAPTSYTDARGTPLRLAPGPTWVEVLPPGTSTFR